MKIGIISGSHRQNSQSSKIAHYFERQIESKGKESWIFELAGNPLPLWDEQVWEKSEHWESLLNPIRGELASCDGFIIISPEWHGQVPAGLKNFFLLFGKNELGHKAALLTAVSAGSGGAYPIAELRMSSYKNNRICYIPEHLIIRDVEKVLNEKSEDNDQRSDTFYRERINWTLDILFEYTSALSKVRNSGVIDTDKFNNGM